jgi:hydrogenase maturation protein HypF
MERRAIAIQGVVQGVGFRPFVYGLASRYHLAGFVKNCVGDVLIEVEGDRPSLDNFLSDLAAHPPPLARIEKLTWESVPDLGEHEFRIRPSDADQASVIFISPDVATCDDCLAEMLDPADRRYRYPFLNCTNCGPRLTIIRGAPYDRPRTTMAGFAMCPACRAEYDDPLNRRFHAQPTCCPVCGPHLRILDGRGTPMETTDPLMSFAEALRDGKIGALKGLGGYHLACDATSRRAVAELRRRKARDEKPFALMVLDADAAEAICVLSPAERELLYTRRRPIVLLHKRTGHSLDGANPIAEEVAPGNPALGLMLPYTPVHHLLLCAVGGIPLVMTSGNRADEPIAYDDTDALKRLGGIADCFLVHDRPIHVRCDDSVTRIVDGTEVPLRRSRGYAPEPIALPMECPLPIAAVGGQLKGTFALGRGRHAFVSHHLGDLDHFEAYQAFVKDLTLYEELFDIKPRLLVHDLHPDYASTRYARVRGEAEGIPLLAVQHHHAHMASCMAEHALTGPVIGVSFDGTGYGTDGAIWGGEFLIGDYAQFRRAAHLRYVGMPGGDQAIREPWRMALAHLLDAGESDAILSRRMAPPAIRTVRQMLERSFNAPMTSSAGRLFDAVAALAMGRDHVSFEGQAAMQLEWLAAGTAGDESYPWEINSSPEAELVIDTRPLIRAVAEDVRRGQAGAAIAHRFHATMAQIVASVCGQIRARTGFKTVVLSGGVFMNALLTSEVVKWLSGTGFAVYRQQKVPPNDGGLSFGQLAIAAVHASRSSPIAAECNSATA